MGKTSRWLKNLLTSGKKHKDKEKSGANQNSSNATENQTILTSTTTPKEKGRWSFRRPSASKQSNSTEPNVTTTPTIPQTSTDADQIQNVLKKHLTITPEGTAPSPEEAAAIKIQSAFRSHLARKALSALRGIVKLQAIVRGQLARKEAIATIRCMEVLLTAQARACANRIRMASEGKSNQRHPTHPKTTQDNLIKHLNDEIDRGSEENIKIVEMDVSESKGSRRSRNNNINYTQHDGSEHRFSTYYPSKEENHKESPAPSTQSSPASKPDDTKLPFASPMTSHNPLVPHYMANTESSRAKFRSHSAPKQRPDSFERQLSRPRASMEARNSAQRPIMRMRRSSSHVGATAQNYPCSIKLDRSTVSLVESQCGSTSTVLTNTQYCRSLVAYNPHEDRYY